MGFAREPGRTKQASWVSCNPESSLNLQPVCVHCDFSDSGTEWCHIPRTSRWQKSGNRGSFFAQVDWTLSSCLISFIDSVAAAFV